MSTLIGWVPTSIGVGVGLSEVSRTSSISPVWAPLVTNTRSWAAARSEKVSNAVPRAIAHHSRCRRIGAGMDGNRSLINLTTEQWEKDRAHPTCTVFTLQAADRERATYRKARAAVN